MKSSLLAALIGGHFTVLAALIQRNSKLQGHKIDEFIEMVNHLDRRLDHHLHCHPDIKGTPDEETNQ